MNIKIPKTEKDVLDFFDNPKVVVENGHITEFEFIHSDITALPENFGNLLYLKEINLCNNKLKNLPESFGNLVNLEILHLKRNNLKSLPVSFNNLKNLKILHLNKNQFVRLPQFFSDLASLEEINLAGNHLESLPSNINHLKNLKHFHLQENKITSFPETFGIIKNLEFLDLSHNQIATLPKSFGNLQNISQLYLNKNNLKIFPDSFENLKNLKFLNLGLNQFSFIPQYFEKFVHLKSLNLYDNMISSPQDIFERMQNLEHLDISNNPIRTLSKFFINMYSENKFVISDLHLTLKGQRLCYFEDPDDYLKLLKYYEKSPEELASQYISNPGSLTDDEEERLVHEARSPEIQILESDLLSNVSILNKIMNRPIEKIPDPIINSLVDTTIPVIDDENSEKEIVRSGEIDEIKFRWFDDTQKDCFQPTITFFGHPELSDHLIGADKIVIKEQQIKIGFSYPLKNSTVQDYYMVGGFTRIELAQCIFYGYSTIYEEKDLKKYGIWGHSMGDLSLICVEYYFEENYCRLRIES